MRQILFATFSLFVSFCALESQFIRMPALAAFPMISVVQPAYHCDPNGGHGSFCPSASLRLSCVLVFATAAARQDPGARGGSIGREVDVHSAG